MNIVKKLFQETFLFKLLYLLFALCSVVPVINVVTGPMFKLVLVYGWLIILYDLVTRNKSLLSNKYVPWMAIFVGWLLLTTVINYDKSLIDNAKMMAYTILQFFLLANIDQNADKHKIKREILWLNRVAIWGLGLICFLSVVLFLFRINGDYVLYQDTELEKLYFYGVAYGNRLTGVTVNPNTLGLVGLIAIAAMFINLRLFTLKRSEKITYGVIFVLSFACFIMSGSRGAELAAVVFFLVYLYFSGVDKLKSRKNLVLKHIAVFCACLAIVGVGYALTKPARKGLGYLPASIAMVVETPEFGEDDENRLDKYYVDLQRDTASDKSGNGRMFLWKAAPKVIKYHAIVGVGRYDVTRCFREVLPNASLPGLEGGGVHNILLQTVVNYGIPAVLLLLLFFGVLAKDGIKVMYSPATRRTRYHLLTAIIAAVLMLFANNMVEANILYSTTFMNCFFMLYLGYLMYFLQKDMDIVSVSDKEEPLPKTKE